MILDFSSNQSTFPNVLWILVGKYTEIKNTVNHEKAPYTYLHLHTLLENETKLKALKMTKISSALFIISSNLSSLQPEK